MKKVTLFFSLMLAMCIAGTSQYTPLPALDENLYAKFIERLRTEARQQDIPELNTMADNMSYDEARRFLANPHVYLKKLKGDQTSQEDKPAMNKRVFGIIAAVLWNSLTGLDNYSSGQAKIGYALGLYSLCALGKAYFLAEFLYQYSIFGEESSDTQYGWTQTYKINYLTLFTAYLYAIQMQSMKLLLGGGLTLGYALSGKETYKDSNGEDTNNMGFGSDDWLRFYAGFNIVAGILTKNMIMIYLAYTLPFTKLHGDWDAKMSLFKLALGIPLSKK